jgi:hypothetical protein
MPLTDAREDADTNFGTTPVGGTSPTCPHDKALTGEVIEVEWASGIKVSIAPPYAAPKAKPPQETVVVPHWKAGTAVADGAGSRRPAVYLLKGKGADAVTVKVKITENRNVSGSGTLAGNFAGLLIEGKCPTSVGEHVVAAKIKNLPDSIQWYQGDASWGLAVPDLGSSVSLANSSRLELFTVLDTPSGFYDPPGVWAEALRFLCQTVGVIGLKTAAELDARVTTYCHGSHGLKYDTRAGRARYGVLGNGGQFQLANYIKASSIVVNCYDQAGAVQSLCGAVGVKTAWYFLAPFGYIKTTDLIGVGACNNPFFDSNGSKPVVAEDDPMRTAFGNHSFCGFTGLILDACAGPHTGSEDKTQYCTASIDSDPALYPPGYSPGKASMIAEEGGITRVV